MFVHCLLFLLPLLLLPRLSLRRDHHGDGFDVRWRCKCAFATLPAVTSGFVIVRGSGSGGGGVVGRGAVCSGAVFDVGSGADEEFDLFVTLAQTLGVDVRDSLQLIENQFQVDESEAEFGQ